MEIKDRKRNKYRKGNTCYPLKDVSAREMERFCRFTKEYGGVPRTIEDRIRYRGFSMWEMNGIANIIREFAEMANDAPIDTRDFFISLSKEDRSAFFGEMYELGMSANTVRTRFTNRTFKRWEMRGIEAIIEDFNLTQKTM